MSSCNEGATAGGPEERADMSNDLLCPRCGAHAYNLDHRLACDACGWRGMQEKPPMSEPSRRCPLCGAESKMMRSLVKDKKKGYKWAEFPSYEWACGTYKTTHDVIHQSDACKITELEQENRRLRRALLEDTP